MPVEDLKKTTMDPAIRSLLRVIVPLEDRALTNERVESLMGRRPEERFRFIQEHARTAKLIDI